MRFKEGEQQAIKSVRAWLSDFVIALNLCPFANKELLADKIRFRVSVALAEEHARLLDDLVFELNYLHEHIDTETTLLILPYTLDDFYDFNDFLVLANERLLALGFEGTFQLASFHPQYQFSGTQLNSVENYTNRSPYPILHIIRECSLEQAISLHPNAERIPTRNIALMNEMGESKVKALLQRIILNALH